MNFIIQKDKAKNYFASYLHGSAFSPVTSTFQQSIKHGNFITWLGVKDINFKKITDIKLSTSQVHLDQERKTLQSTKTAQSVKNEDSYPEKIQFKTETYNSVIIPTQNTTKKRESPAHIKLVDFPTNILVAIGTSWLSMIMTQTP